jgi:predicted small lipoprotein YifL
MIPMKTIIIVLALALGLAACGIKGNPEAPPAFTGEAR